MIKIPFMLSLHRLRIFINSPLDGEMRFVQPATSIKRRGFSLPK